MNRENLLHALMFLFENYLEDSTDVLADTSDITDDMLEAGFAKTDISKALTWFDDLNMIRQNVTGDKTFTPLALRTFTDYEADKITVEARGYLLFLEQAGIVDPISRELVIDRVMALEQTIIDVPELKWVALMVLFSQAEKHNKLRLMEDLVLVHEDATPH